MSKIKEQLIISETYETILNSKAELQRDWSLSNCHLDVKGIKAQVCNLKASFKEGSLKAEIEGKKEGPPEKHLYEMFSESSSFGGTAGTIVEDERFGDVKGESPKEKVSLTAAFLGGGEMRGDGNFHYPLSVKSIKSEQANHTPDQYIDSYILQNFYLPCWREFSQTSTEHKESLNRNRITLKIKGKRLFLQKIDECYTRLLFQGVNLEQFYNESFLNEILLCLSFMCSSRVRVITRELWSTKGVNIKKIYCIGATKEDSYGKLIPFDTSYSSNIYYSIKTCLEGYLEWKEHILLDEVIHHLLTANESPQEITFAIRAIAFETLSSSYSRFRYSDSKNTTSKYINQQEFKKRLKPVKNIFKEQFEDILPKQDYKSIEGKLLSINNRAMRNRAKTLLEDFGIKIDENIKKILELRNNAIHEGVLNRDKRNDYQLISDFSSEMLTLVNRLLLKLFNFNGMYIDYGKRGHPPARMAKKNND